jgi:hypothetical protein
VSCTNLTYRPSPPLHPQLIQGNASHKVGAIYSKSIVSIEHLLGRDICCGGRWHSEPNFEPRSLCLGLPNFSVRHCMDSLLRIASPWGTLLLQVTSRIVAPLPETCCIGLIILNSSYWDSFSWAARLWVARKEPLLYEFLELGKFFSLSHWELSFWEIPLTVTLFSMTSSDWAPNLWQLFAFRDLL